MADNQQKVSEGAQFVKESSTSRTDDMRPLPLQNGLYRRKAIGVNGSTGVPSLLPARRAFAARVRQVLPKR